MYDVIKYSLKETFSLSILNGITRHRVKTFAFTVRWSLILSIYVCVRCFFPSPLVVRKASPSRKCNGFKDDKRRIIKIRERQTNNLRNSLKMVCVAVLCCVLLHLIHDIALDSFVHAVKFCENELIWVMASSWYGIHQLLSVILMFINDSL